MKTGIKIKEALAHYNKGGTIANKREWLTQTALSKEMPGPGSSEGKRQRLFAYIKGRHDCPLAMLIWIANRLEVTTDFLLGESESPTNAKTASFSTEGGEVNISIK